MSTFFMFSGNQLVSKEWLMRSVSVTDNSFEHILTILWGILSYPVAFFPFIIDKSFST